MRYENSAWRESRRLGSSSSLGAHRASPQGWGVESHCGYENSLTTTSQPEQLLADCIPDCIPDCITDCITDCIPNYITNCIPNYIPTPYENSFTTPSQLEQLFAKSFILSEFRQTTSSTPTSWAMLTSLKDVY